MSKWLRDGEIGGVYWLYGAMALLMVIIGMCGAGMMAVAFAQ